MKVKTMHTMRKITTTMEKAEILKLKMLRSEWGTSITVTCWRKNPAIAPKNLAKKSPMTEKKRRTRATNRFSALL